MRKTRFVAGLLPGATLLALTIAPFTATQAATATANLTVSATVTANCTVSTSALAFGNVNRCGANVDSTGGLSVTCTNGTAWSRCRRRRLGLRRELRHPPHDSGGNLLNYNLYTSAARTTVWGDGTASTATIGGTGTGTAQSVTVYGRVSSGQTRFRPAPMPTRSPSRSPTSQRRADMRLTPLFVLLGLTSVRRPACPAAAGTLTVNPVLVEIGAARRRIGHRPQRERPVTIRAYPLAWRQAGGEDRYEETSAVIVSPPVFTIPPAAPRSCASACAGPRPPRPVLSPDHRGGAGGEARRRHPRRA